MLPREREQERESEKAFPVGDGHITSSSQFPFPFRTLCIHAHTSTGLAFFSNLWIRDLNCRCRKTCNEILKKNVLSVDQKIHMWDIATLTTMSWTGLAAFFVNTMKIEISMEQRGDSLILYIHVY